MEIKNEDHICNFKNFVMSIAESISKARPMYSEINTMGNQT